MHNGMVETDAEKMSKSEGNIFQLSEALDRYGREAVVAYLVSGHYRQPLAFGAEALERGGGAGRAAAQLLPRAAAGRGGPDDEFVDAPRARARSSTPWPTTSTRRGRWPRLFELVAEATGASCPGRRAALRGDAGAARARVAAEPRTRPADARPSALLAEREEARAAQDFERADEIRDELAELGWEVRDTRRGRAARAGAAERGRAARDRSTAAAPVAEAERGRRRVHRVWRAPETSAEELERLCGSPDHQGVVAEVDPYPYADPARCCADEDALLVALDQVQDPRNLGAVCRSAEVAGAAGVVIPERRAAAGDRGRLQGLGGRGRAPRGRPGPQPRRLARRGEGGRLLDLGRRRRRRAAPCGEVDLERPDGARPRRRGEGHPAPGGLGLRRRSSRCRSAGRVESLNVSAAAAALLFEAVRQRG